MFNISVRSKNLNIRRQQVRNHIMASGRSGIHQQLTRSQIVRLARAISADNMASIAEGYMDIDHATIKNIERDTRGSEAFNREIIRCWTYKSSENQREVRFLTKQHFFIKFCVVKI